MATILSNNLLVNGLSTEFADTYGKIRNRQSDGRLSLIMDTVTATNRYQSFAYLNAAPHMEYWKRGTTVPTGAMDSVQFTVSVYEWSKRVPWSKFDRKDDQTQSLFEMARGAGESAALLEERFAFDLMTANAGALTSTLPAVPNAPDGVAMFSATDGSSADRFGVSGGNIVTSSGVATTHDVRNDYYSGVIRFGSFLDGQGQPLLSPETIGQGVLIVHSLTDTEVMEETFKQVRQAVDHWCD